MSRPRSHCSPFGQVFSRSGVPGPGRIIIVTCVPWGETGNLCLFLLARVLSPVFPFPARASRSNPFLSSCWAPSSPLLRPLAAILPHSNSNLSVSLAVPWYQCR